MSLEAMIALCSEFIELNKNLKIKYFCVFI